MEMVNKETLFAASATTLIALALLLAALIVGVWMGDVFETYHNASSL